MSVVVTAVLTPKASAYDRVISALSSSIAEVHGEPGCELYAIHKAPDGQIVIVEKWESPELLDMHGDGAAVERLNASLEGLLDAVQVTRLAPIPVGSSRQGSL